jgi:hypothetical protein
LISASRQRFEVDIRAELLCRVDIMKERSRIFQHKRRSAADSLSIIGGEADQRAKAGKHWQGGLFSLNFLIFSNL